MRKKLLKDFLLGWSKQTMASWRGLILWISMSLFVFVGFQSRDTNLLGFSIQASMRLPITATG
jgi:hypothetical protein